MFNRKKHEIERLRAENKELNCKLGNVTTRDAHEVAELYNRLFEEREANSNLLKENSQITDANGSIKRALQTEKKQSDKLRQLLAAANDQAAQAEADKRRLQGENRALREKIEEAQRHSTCPADCVHRTNPNACRTCTRYQKAHDKYEATS